MWFLYHLVQKQQFRWFKSGQIRFSPRTNPKSSISITEPKKIIFSFLVISLILSEINYEIFSCSIFWKSDFIKGKRKKLKNNNKNDKKLVKNNRKISVTGRKEKRYI